MIVLEQELGCTATGPVGTNAPTIGTTDNTCLFSQSGTFVPTPIVDPAITIDRPPTLDDGMRGTPNAAVVLRGVAAVPALGVAGLAMRVGRVAAVAAFAAIGRRGP